jgi:hypothetical protein
MKTNLLALLCLISTVAEGELIKIYVGRVCLPITRGVTKLTMLDRMIISSLQKYAMQMSGTKSVCESWHKHLLHWYLV